MIMNTLSANEAKTHFGNLLLKVQSEPIQINKNGKPVAVVISAEEYEIIEVLKLHQLQARAAQCKADIESGNLADGESFFKELESGHYD